MRVIAIVLGILASAIGVLNAISAFGAVGANPAYAARLWAGWASIVLAILAGVAAILISIYPRTASLIMLITGIVGFVCINLFYINTLYILAIPLWLLSTILAYISASKPTSRGIRAES